MPIEPYIKKIRETPLKVKIPQNASARPYYSFDILLFYVLPITYEMKDLIY